jgi:TolB protein
MDADGTGEMQLTSFDDWDGSGDWYPGDGACIADWSPDGTKIIFASCGGSQIYSMNAAGSGFTPLTDDDGDSNEPSWSPDGRRIVYVSHIDGPYDIYVMNADGSGKTRLNVDDDQFGGKPEEPDWSPDGSKIVFDGGGGIYTINADGSDQTHLTSGTTPSWGR